jgi:molybdate transport system substrate-binding protein
VLAAVALVAHAAVAARAAVPAGGRADGPLTVAAASDLQAVLPLVSDRFERDFGHRVRLTFGSSGNFFAQIRSGAPFDVFFSADLEYPSRLVEAGLVERDGPVQYATGRLVVLGRQGLGVDVRQGLAVLTDPRIRRIAIANPDHAPYGRAAVAALRSAGLYDQVRSKLVHGEHVSQAALFVDSGGADAGIIALSLARTPALRDRGAVFEIPSSLHPPIAQAVVIMTASRRKVAARQLLRYMGRPDIVELLQTFGFTPPPGAGK